VGIHQRRRQQHALGALGLEAQGAGLLAGLLVEGQQRAIAADQRLTTAGRLTRACQEL
jgi:hypothetical protein